MGAAGECCPDPAVRWVVCCHGSHTAMLPRVCSLPVTDPGLQDHPGVRREGRHCVNSHHDGVSWGSPWTLQPDTGAPLQGRGTCIPAIVVAEPLLCPQPWYNSVLQ